MKRWIHASTAPFDNYTYGSHYVIQSGEGGWDIVDYRGTHIAGPFRTWIEAEEWIDQKDAEEGYR